MVSIIVEELACIVQACAIKSDTAYYTLPPGLEGCVRSLLKQLDITSSAKQIFKGIQHKNCNQCSGCEDCANSNDVNMIDLDKYTYDLKIPDSLIYTIPEELLEKATFNDAMHIDISIRYLEYIFEGERPLNPSLFQEIVAQLFALRYRYKIAVCQQEVYLFLGHGWVQNANHFLPRIVQNGFKTFLETYIRPHFKKPEKIDLFYRVIQTLENSAVSRIEERIIKLMRLDNLFEKRIFKFNKKLLFRNGVVDLDNSVKKAVLRPGRPSDFMVTSTGNNFRKPSEEERQKLYKFLDSFFPDPAMLKYILDTCAQFLAGRNRDKKLFFWIGVGGNGKTVFMNFLRLGFGGYWVSVPIEMFTEQLTSNTKCTHSINHLKSALLATATEPSAGAKLLDSSVKILTGNDPLPSRGLYKNMEDINISCQFVIIGNSITSVKSMDHAFKERLEVAEFSTIFCEEDQMKDLIQHNEVINQSSQFKEQKVHVAVRDRDVEDSLDKFAECLIYELVNRYVEKCRDTKREIPDVVKLSTHKARESQNIVGNFLRATFEDPKKSLQTLQKDQGMRLEMDFIYEKYQHYLAREYSLESPLSKEDLKNAIRNVYCNNRYIEFWQHKKKEYLLGHCLLDDDVNRNDAIFIKNIKPPKQE